MKIVGTCRVVDALGEWGTHNTPWRANRQISDASEGVDFALTYYSQLVTGILALSPFGCVRGEISAEDIPQLRLYDGSLAEQWATKIQDKNYVRAMADADSEVLGPLTCTCKGDVTPGGLQLSPPFVIFDGWNRMAAWILHGRQGKTYSIAANIILTKRGVNH
jgi:hypothetical protein